MKELPRALSHTSMFSRPRGDRARLFCSRLLAHKTGTRLFSDGGSMQAIGRRLVGAVFNARGGVGRLVRTLVGGCTGGAVQHLELLAEAPVRVELKLDEGRA